MRTLVPALADHLSGEVQSTCNCWVVRRIDGVVLGFTDHDRDLALGDIQCAAGSGFESSEALSELGLSADDQDVASAFSADSINGNDLLSGLYDGAYVEQWLVNWNDTAQAHHFKTAVLGEVQLQGERFKVELRGLTSLLDQPTGRLFARRCDATLGDHRCTADIQGSRFRGIGTITEVLDRRVFKASGLEQFSTEWFAGGHLVFSSGNNDGRSIEVTSNNTTSATIRLWAAPTHPLRGGDHFEIFAGCNKSFATCFDKFDNALNFQGCPHMPTGDVVFNYVDKNTLHDGRPLVK